MIHHEIFYIENGRHQLWVHLMSTLPELNALAKSIISDAQICNFEIEFPNNNSVELIQKPQYTLFWFKAGRAIGSRNKPKMYRLYMPKIAYRFSNTSIPHYGEERVALRGVYGKNNLGNVILNPPNRDCFGAARYVYSGSNLNEIITDYWSYIFNLDYGSRWTRKGFYKALRLHPEMDKKARSPRRYFELWETLSPEEVIEISENCDYIFESSEYYWEYDGN